MSDLKIVIGDTALRGDFLVSEAPATCALFQTMLPFRSKLIHARWSGEACWTPLGSWSVELDPESATSYPSPGTIILYPGGISESEILIPYGAARFASKAGQLAGNPFIRIDATLEELGNIGRETLWNGNRELLIEAA